MCLIKLPLSFKLEKINQMDNLDMNNRIFYLVMTSCMTRWAYKNVLKIICKKLFASYVHGGSNHINKRGLLHQCLIIPSDQYFCIVYLSFILLSWQAYRRQFHMIATQSPLPDTVEDFWNVISNEKIKVIVQLDNPLVCAFFSFC